MLSIKKHSLKLFLLLFISLSTFFSCKDGDFENSPISKQGDFIPLSNISKSQIEKLNLLYSTHFYSIFLDIEKTRSTNDSNVYNNEKIILLANENILNLGLDYNKDKIIPNAKNIFLDKTQIDIYNSFYNEIAKIKTPNDALNLAVKYRPIIDQTKLSKDEKFKLFAITEYVFVAGKFLSENLEFQNVVNGKSLKVNGCDVDWHEVFATGLGSGFVAGVSAGYIGATAGTVTIPIIGTVTGGVSGFIAGFAGGFTGGTVAETIKQLIRKCGPPRRIIAHKIERCPKTTFEWDNFSYLVFVNQNNSYCKPTIIIENLY